MMGAREGIDKAMMVPREEFENEESKSMENCSDSRRHEISCSGNGEGRYQLRLDGRRKAVALWLVVSSAGFFFSVRCCS